MKEKKAVKVTDVRGYTLPDSDRTLFAGSVYRVPEHVARDVVKSGRGEAAKGGQAQNAVEIGEPESPQPNIGGSGGTAASSEAANVNRPAGNAESNDNKKAAKST